MVMKVLDSLIEMRSAFQLAHIEPPKEIRLSSRRGGNIFMRELGAMVQNAPVAAGYKAVVSDGLAWIEVEFMGMKIKWPAD